MAARRSAGSLRTYREKRDFRRTSEPRGRERRSRGGLAYCIQKHSATALHFDLRLELDGVLKSWAVPRGPSLAAGERRLAQHVEDHPLDYGDFEGVIPEGEYGAGTVLLWDRGTWEPEGDARQGYAEGELVFQLHGERLLGRWRLVRMKGAAARGDGDPWLLMKSRDEHAGGEDEIVRREVESIASGRTLEEIAREEGGTDEQIRKARQRDGHGEVARGSPRSKAKKKARKKGSGKKKANPAGKKAAGSPGRPARSSGARRRGGARATDGGLSALELPQAARRGKLPRFVEPQLATLAEGAPAGGGWLHEIKLDGYRILARKDGEAVTLRSRNDRDWTRKLGPLAGALAELPARQALLDGEVVVFRPDGRTSFERLKERLGAGAGEELVYLAFDLLFAGGHDLRGAPLLERKELLRALLAELGGEGPLRFSEHVAGNGPAFHAQACKLGLEGVLSKRAGAPYRSGRGKDWLKLKCVQRQEFVVAGYTPPSGSGAHLGALVLGVHEGDRLLYAGRVGTGFDARQRRELRQALDRRARKSSPFASEPEDRGLRGVTWARPELVAEVQFTEWTRDGRLRHPSFKGLREDKPAREIVRERPRAVSSGSRGRGSGKRLLERHRRDGGKEVSVSDPTAGTREIEGVRLTHPDRVLFPEQGLTKLDLIEHYRAVAVRMLPHLERRPLTLVRCPKGAGAACFYQKHASGSEPDAIEILEIREKEGKQPYMAVSSLAGIVACVQIGVLELHVWGSRADRIERPDRLVFDLDPDEGLAFARVAEAARGLRDRLESLGLASFALATGGKGLHVVVPLERHHDFDQVKAFARAVAKAMEREHRDRFIAQASKQKRAGKIFVDYLRNARGATAICPWSTRARKGAPVAVPLRWDEVTARLDPAGHTVSNLGRRLAADPWEGYFDVRQRLTAAARRELGLT